ncbi:hypothetical protein A5893_05300 [Pedobacter psychrophilus]|uniref:Peptidase M14 domain-containing protein n=2 Tax=Pedobacter psychrophilus TaxID=1826909 RepID=A0A179DH17_9SPHI|nr:hypothetical protein A5893_05300 [Pedobacter psychrophilus]
MRLLLLISFFLIFNMMAFAQQTPFEKSNGTKTATYQECIDFYKSLADHFDQIKMLTYGKTDIGKPLNLVVLSKEKVFDPQEIHQQKKVVLLINNGIHPGEPEGIDATMILTRELLVENKLPDNVVICIIPIYNIDGALNRGNYSRVNQDGPESYGFRGNAKNLDLNRDFIKTDSKNSYQFQKIFNEWNPEIFVDNHTSNGADYQYIMTLIETQKDKLNPILSNYSTKEFVPYLYQQMKKAGFEMIPYVDHPTETPDGGIEGFLEIARYSTGYAALHNTIGFMPETHMLKPFADREKATHAFMKIVIDKVTKDAKLIKENKAKADLQVQNQKTFPINWKLNKDSFNMISFKGFEAGHKPSEVSGKSRLYYDRTKSFTKDIKQFNQFDVTQEVEKPYAYIIPQAWEKVIDLLKLNGVKTQQLAKDFTLEVEASYIDDYQTVPKPFEGHYLHSKVVLRKVKTKINYYEGDVVVLVDQKSNRYIMETLEPQAPDSFLAWNFFDSILGQKEHFSDYVFEDLAADLLNKNPELRKRLEDAKKADSKLNDNGQAQLNWVYENSPYFEPTYLRYPITRLNNTTELKLK